MKKWSVKKADRSVIDDLAAKYADISALTASVLVSRGYNTADEVAERLNISELSDPFLLRDMQTAVDIINSAVDNGDKICIYGDYDCDGVMSVVMLYSYLLETGADVLYYIPEREDGFGMNSGAVRKLAESGVDLIITVDNGISAFDEADLIYELGMKLIITDHHQPGGDLPKAEAVVDPHRADCFSPYKNLCGAGLVLKLIAALNEGDYTMALEQFGDLAAIATVADVVSLTGENRYIVTCGLKLINNTDRISLAALKTAAGYSNKKIDSGSVAFGLTPRINAAGRLGSADTAVKLFLSEDPSDAAALAETLSRLNAERQDTEKRILDEIYKMISEDPVIVHKRVIFIAGKGWHHGTIGIVAARITEKYGKPCFIASEENNEMRGSARSFGSFSVFEALSACSGALEKFGGHPGAGGFTIKSGMTAEFDRLLQKYAAENFKVMPVFTVTVDSAVSPSDLTVEAIESLSRLEPYGQDNEKPLFLMQNCRVRELIPLKNGTHTKLVLKFGYTEAEALLFRVSPQKCGIKTGESYDFIVSLGLNTYRDEPSVEIIIKDYRRSGIDQSRVFSALDAYEAFLRNEPLPKKYYERMYPDRSHCVTVYKGIPADGIDYETLFFTVCTPELNFCRFAVAVDALTGLGLIGHSADDNMLHKIPVTKKADLDSAEILVRLRKLMGK